VSPASSGSAARFHKPSQPLQMRVATTAFCTVLWGCAASPHVGPVLPRLARSPERLSGIKWSQRVNHQAESDTHGYSVGEYFLHMAQARLRRDAGPRDGGPALRAALARRPRAPHRTPRPPTEQEAAPQSITRALLSTQLLIAFHCAEDGRVRHAPGCRKPQPSPPRSVALSTP
jgi:hypothetical protein